MISSIFQQRYLSDKGWIVVHQQGLEPAAGEAVFLESGEPAPDDVYQCSTAEEVRRIEVREGMVHFYYHHRKESDIGTSNTFIIIIATILILFILFRVLGRH
ncbi:MAG TPA: hypothetical protein VGE66_06940 [Chitinophagaceae bacterium]